VPKLIILSIVIVSFVVPIRLSTAKRPRLALRRAQQIVAVCIVVWAFMCLRWYPAIQPLE
jgi:hypothetical protein